MRKSLLIALCLGLAVCKAEAQIQSFSAGSVTVSSKAPPGEWFNTVRERELAAALRRLANQINSEKDVKRREFAKEQIALGLARLGREKEARKLAKSADSQLEITYFTAVRAIFSGREDDAIARLPKLSGWYKWQVQIMLGSAFSAWRNDKNNARKWLLAARNNPDPFVDLYVAAGLAKIGATDDARAIFSEIEESSRKQTANEGGPTHPFIDLVTLFEARLKSGLDNDALAMLKNDKTWLNIAIARLFRYKKDSAAMELLKHETPSRRFEILRNFNGAAEDEDRNRTAFEAMRSLWSQLSSKERNDLDSATVMAVSIAHFDSVHAAYGFIEANFKDRFAKTVAKGLKEDLLSSPELQKQINPEILQSWKEELLKTAEIEARKQTADSHNSNDAEEEWMYVSQSAFDANNLKKARFALEKAEQIAARGQSNYPLRNALKRYNAWKRLGDKKRVQQNLMRFKRASAKLADLPDTTYLYSDIFSDSDLMREIFLTKPPRDLRVIAVFASGEIYAKNSPLIPVWMTRIRDTSTRAVAVANRTKVFYPLDNIRIALD